MKSQIWYNENQHLTQIISGEFASDCLNYIKMTKIELNAIIGQKGLLAISMYEHKESYKLQIS